MYENPQSIPPPEGKEDQITVLLRASELAIDIKWLEKELKGLEKKSKKSDEDVRVIDGLMSTIASQKEIAGQLKEKLLNMEKEKDESLNEFLNEEARIDDEDMKKVSNVSLN